eukprot:scaffold83971_cov63-Phaeocystis_antarctica.AAC.1
MKRPSERNTLPSDSDRRKSRRPRTACSTGPRLVRMRSASAFVFLRSRCARMSRRMPSFAPCHSDEAMSSGASKMLPPLRCGRKLLPPSTADCVVGRASASCATAADKASAPPHHSSAQTARCLML